MNRPLTPSPRRALTRLLPALLVLPASLGCVAAAAAGAGFIVSQQVLPNRVHLAQVRMEVGRVWPSVQETVGLYQEPGIQLKVQEFPRSIEAKVSGATVTVEVEAVDVDRTTIRVSAEKYLTKDETTAERVLDGILDRLGKL